MVLHGRSRELGLLRGALDRTEASLVQVTGLRGVGKTALIKRVCQDFRSAYLRCPPASEAEQRTGFARLLDAEGRGSDWDEVLAAAALRAEPGEAPFVLVIDDAYRLTQSRARIEEPLARLMRAAAQELRPLHVVLATHDPLGGDEGWPDGLGTTRIRVPPLTLRGAMPMLPGSEPRDFIRAFGAFGGIPSVLQELDRSVTVETNIRKTCFEPDGRLAELGREYLERDVQNPTRYYALMRVLGEGETDWASLHAGVPDLTRSGQVAPYLKRLEELGLVETRRSLDARARSRARRYSTADPFLTFWFRFVLPRLHAPDADATAYLSETVRPAWDDHTQRIFPLICRQYMEHDAVEHFGANARESGGLWGSDYDIDVAGILTSGAAYYGRCAWRGPPAGSRWLEDLDVQIRETRYGFGREARLRVLFSARTLPRDLEREIARRHDAFSIEVEALTGLDGE